MLVKMLLNIFINIAIFVLLLTIFWAFKNEFYPILAAAIVSLAMFIYFKIKIVKSVRELIRRK